MENLFKAWKEFSKGKKSKKEVSQFELNLETNLFALYESLVNESWKPDPYRIRLIQDPKLRKIHIASVRDRVLYQAVYRKLYPIFDIGFIFDSYSSRKNKGTHAGVNRLEEFTRKVTANFTRVGFALKCDIRKFFDSIDHEILISLISKRIGDIRLLKLVQIIVESLQVKDNCGLPLGNVTSQIFSNIYLNELDHFVKHVLKAKYYIRYCDDFIILDKSKQALDRHITSISYFLKNKLRLDLHPNKVAIRKINNGIDFLGYVLLPQYRVLRTKTKKRMFKKINSTNLTSYRGMLSHCSGYHLLRRIDAICK